VRERCQHALQPQTERSRRGHAASTPKCRAFVALLDHHDPQPLGLDTTLAPLRLVTRGMIRCAQSGLASSRSRARMPPHLGAAPRPGLTQKASAWLHAFPLLPLQIQGLGSGQGCQRTAIPRQHKTERDAAVERNCVGRQERRALGAALACTAASAEFRARCAQKGLCLGGTSAPL
jgi:hypothetical protein